MKGVEAAFSSKEKVRGVMGAHSYASFVKDVDTLLKAWQNSRGFYQIYKGFCRKNEKARDKRYC